MNSRDVFNNFMEHIKNGEQSFVLMTDRNTSVNFISAQHGAATYYYSCKTYGQDDFLGLRHEYEIAAIYANGKLYVIDWLAFDAYTYSVKNSDELAEISIVDFYKMLAEINDYLRKVAYPTYYKELKATMHDDEQMIDKNIIRMARYKMLDRDLQDRSITEVSQDKAAKMLCYAMDFNAICREVLDEQRSHIDYIKSLEERIDSITEESVEPWEIEIATALKNIEAKTVIIELELNGKSGEIKIECEKLIDILVKKDYFSDYNFPNTKEGKSLIKKLGASEYHYTPETNLYAKNIKSITFRGKKIYERKA